MDIFFSRLNARQLIALIVISMLSYLANQYWPANISYWLMLAAISAISLNHHQQRSATSSEHIKSVGVMSAFYSEAAQLLTLLLAGVCSGIVIFIAGLLQQNAIAMMTYIFLITLICCFIIWRQTKHARLCFWLVTFTIIATLQTVSLNDNIYRSLSLLSGYLLVMLMIIDLPKRYRQQRIQLIIDAMLRSLNQLATDIFACFSVQYAESIYLHERRLHTQKLKYIHLVEQLRSYGEEDSIVMAANAIFESLIDCSQLRWRVADAATFELCQQEMSALKRAITASFNMLIKINIKQTNYPLVAIDEQIDALESSYQSVLQIAAKEPFVFLLFIASLSRLQNAIHAFYAKDQPHVEV